MLTGGLNHRLPLLHAHGVIFAGAPANQQPVDTALHLEINQAAQRIKIDALVLVKRCNQCGKHPLRQRFHVFSSLIC